MEKINIENESIVFHKEERPTCFKEVVGQEDILKQIDNAIATNQVQYAYIFEGLRGTGKTSVARIMSNKLICQSRTEDNEPCKKCRACKTYKNNPMQADIIEINSADSRGIKEMRELKSQLGYATEFGYRIVIIDEVHKVTEDGATALLKTLEEPPKNTVFILVTTDVDKILPEIRSRCITFKFEPISPGHIKEKLLQVAFNRGIEITEEAVNEISLNSEGCLRDALKFLQQAYIKTGGPIKKEDLRGIFNIEGKYIKQLISLMLSGKANESLICIDSNSKNISMHDFDYILKRLRYIVASGKGLSQCARGVLLHLMKIFIDTKRQSVCNIKSEILLEVAILESVLYINDNEDAKKEIIDSLNLNKNLKTMENKKISINKKELFFEIIAVADEDMKLKLSASNCFLDNSGSILEFRAKTAQEKELLREILKQDIPQRAKHVAGISGFIVKTKKEKSNKKDNC